MEGISVGRGGDGPSPDLVQEALALCSNACGKVGNLYKYGLRTTCISDNSAVLAVSVHPAHCIVISLLSNTYRYIVHSVFRYRAT